MWLSATWSMPLRAHYIEAISHRCYLRDSLDILSVKSLCLSEPIVNEVCSRSCINISVLLEWFERLARHRSNGDKNANQLWFLVRDFIVQNIISNCFFPVPCTKYTNYCKSVYSTIDGNNPGFAANLAVEGNVAYVWINTTCRYDFVHSLFESCRYISTCIDHSCSDIDAGNIEHISQVINSTWGPDLCHQISM